MKIIVRSIYSNPPAHGARIASMCLNNRDMRAEWEDCVKEMHARFVLMICIILLIIWVLYIILCGRGVGRGQNGVLLPPLCNDHCFRIRRSRSYLHTALKTVNAPGSWDHILAQNGMFSYTGNYN